jgi:hypothetical protein
MSANLATVSAAIEPRDMTELRALASAAAVSKLFGVTTPEQALLVMMTGRDLGLSYPQSLRAFHVVQGRPVLSAAGAVAICLRHKDICEYVRTVEATDASATVEVKRTGDPARRTTFTIDDARRAKLDGKDVWKAYPSRMLLARAQMFACREVFPDLLLGLYDADELEPAPASPQRRQVEVQAHVVPEAAPTPRSAQAEPDECADAYAARLTAASSKAELAAIGAELGAAKRAGDLTPTEVATLARAYNAASVRIAEALAPEAENLEAEPA